MAQEKIEVIRLENVVKMDHKNRRVVNSVNLRIQKKERAAICGVPGSGKDTLMRIIAGMELPSEGKVFVLDKAVYNMNAGEAAVFRNRNIGIIRRETGLMERLNVFENVSLPLAIQRMPSLRRKQAAKEQLKLLGIFNIAHAYPVQLSAYEALMASAARALIIKPKILLLYEVTAGLSERETAQFTDMIDAIFKYGDHTVLSFGINPAGGFRMDKTILLDHGKIQEDIS